MFIIVINFTYFQVRVNSVFLHTVKLFAPDELSRYYVHNFLQHEVQVNTYMNIVPIVSKLSM